ncbi:FTR1 family protein [Bdellovibrio sp. ZAP7]|uniref:FTR1 family protein n=1 Tax=Bdellovibrio sp. ZAP7 TaxID=2231053 RepID=UPI00143CF42E|nr:FTR1 family protein [Bdellovibrio sp. ZAP7]
MKQYLSLMVFITLFGFFNLKAAVADEVKNPSIVVHLLDYLAKDYGGAVRNGKVLSKSEYQEQVEFSEIVGKASRAYDEYKHDVAFVVGVDNLVLKIKNKASADEVSKLARELQTNAISLAKIEIAPQDYPLVSEGQKIFAQNCASCHGSSGMGDGLAGQALNPKPANFHESERQFASSPFQYFNTIRLGVPGTAMPPFPSLSDKEIWSLAFFVKSLGYQKPEGKLSTELSLKQVSSLKDEEILKSLTGSEVERKQILALIRTFEPAPKEGSQFLAIARTHLNQSYDHFNRGEYELATSESVKSYLQGIEPIEPKIKANQAGLVEKIEAQMSAYRNSLNAATAKDIASKNYQSIMSTFTEIQNVTEAKMMSPQLAFTAAFAIFLREGFEAVLIIITLLGVIKAFGAKEAAKWVHFGWISALALGAVVWFASGLLLNMSGASREIMEGSISLFAVVVLLYVGFWLHRQTEVGRWTKFVRETLKEALEKKSLIVLSSISFMAVFREAFEVVLFLRAIWNDVNADGRASVGEGVALAFILIFAFSYYAVRYSQKIPIKQLFNVSAAIMGILSVILVGKGIHSLQEAGIVGVKSIGLGLRVDLLGIFPSIQTVVAQLLIAAVLLIIWSLGKKPAAAPLGETA